MVFHKFKNFLLLKIIKLNSFIKYFIIKNFFLLIKTNFLFIFNFFNYGNKINNLIKINNLKKNILTNNIYFFLNKKKYNKNKKFRFLYTFFDFINFNLFKKNLKYYNFNNNFFFFPKMLFFNKIKNKKIIIFCIIKKKKNLFFFSKILKIIILKIKNLIFLNLLYKNLKKNNLFIKKKFFFKNLCKIKKNINIGNLTQCVISNILYKKNFFFNFNVNLSIYNIYINFKETIIFLNSPEFLLRLEKNQFFTKPIAGTADKKHHFKKLLKNKKEISEHLMLLDLSINDSFKNNLKKILLKRLIFCQHYKNLLHIVSEICFSVTKSKIFKIIKNLFPAGTLSGSPKEYCLKLINIIEKKNRNFYGGIFYFFNKNNLESSIFIRMKHIKNNNIVLESGAGIIDKSINILEWLETILKKQNFLK